MSFNDWVGGEPGQWWSVMLIWRRNTWPKLLHD